mmetsp:Transcript_39372/g.62406  ORF Transcript_39372/g.62406 Transcript_39372/m.62406 type:complete len:89 (+) Transcript_39372:133-399(+)
MLQHMVWTKFRPLRRDSMVKLVTQKSTLQFECSHCSLSVGSCMSNLLVESPSVVFCTHVLPRTARNAHILAMQEECALTYSYVQGGRD